MNNIKITIILILICSCTYSFTYASTSVSGNIVENTIWDKSGSPYIINGTVQFLDGAVLEIKPGVTIQFNLNSGLNIAGTIKAIGEKNNFITFTSNLAEPYPGSWNQIRITNESPGATIDYDRYIDGNIFKYCVVEYAGNGITGAINPDADVFISNCIIKNNQTTGIRIHSPYSAIIECTIFNNNTTGWGGGISFQSGGLIKNNIIKNNSASNGGGIHIEKYDYNQKTPAILKNEIFGNSKTSVLGCSQIYLRYGECTIKFNKITGSNHRDIFIINSENYSEIKYNDLVDTQIFVDAYTDYKGDFNFNNITYNNTSGGDSNYIIYFEERGGQSFDVNMMHNWWDSNIDIANSIYDYYDNVNCSAKVIYEPVAEEPFTIIDTDDDDVIDLEDNCPEIRNMNQADIDGDGIGDACDSLNNNDVDGDGYLTRQGDCNDNNASINPGAAEICNDGIDNDCDGDIDGNDSDCQISTDNDGDSGGGGGGGCFIEALH